MSIFQAETGKADRSPVPDKSAEKRNELADLHRFVRNGPLEHAFSVDYKRHNLALGKAQP